MGGLRTWSKTEQDPDLVQHLVQDLVQDLVQYLVQQLAQDLVQDLSRTRTWSKTKNHTFLIKIIEFDLKWIHLARNGVILRIYETIWLRIVSKTPCPIWAIKGP